MADLHVAAVVIGRNEGERLVACLASLQGSVDQIVYVDSGSTDGSVAAAEASGALVVSLDLSQPFTAARARNAGFAKVLDADFVQFVDGDCSVAEGWLNAALREIQSDGRIGVVCGRRREKHPEASIYNRLCDREWDRPPGLTKSCGGDALFRVDALTAVNGYRDDLIAGEEPELCFRLRRVGWRLIRIADEMTLHDAAIHRFGQFWKRNRRAGHAFAEGAWLHGRSAERFRVRETARALFWGAALPLAILLAAFVTPFALLLCAVYALQVARQFRIYGGIKMAALQVAGRFAEAQGVLQFLLGKIFARRSRIIEYK